MKKVVFITGISSGFGKEISRLLAAGNYIVYGTVRKECNVPDGVHPLMMDLTQPKTIKNAIETVIEKEGRIDVLINNAGMHSGGPIEEMDSAVFEAQINANVIGLIYVLQNALPHMRKLESSLIVNIGSIGGLMGLPFQGIYSASKFAIEGISEALRMELKQFNVKVVVINPGDFHTSNTANRINNVIKGGPYEVQFNKSIGIIGKDETGGWDPVVLAKKVCKIIGKKNPKYRYIIGSTEQKLAVLVKRILPPPIFAKILSSHYGI